jgi:hypothetical protein
MRIARRVVSGATALALLGAVGTMGPVRAASTGVGTGKITTTLFGVNIGDGSLLNVKVLADQSRSTIDPATNKTAEAFTTLSPLHIGSTVPAANYDVPALEARQPVGKATDERSVILTPSPALAPVIDGKVDLASLSSAVDSAGARSTLSSALADLKLVGGLANVHAVSSSLNTTAAPGAATATRALKIDAVTVLNLGDLLKGLGINITDLSLSQVDTLLNTLKTATAGTPVGATLASTIAGAQTEVATLKAAIISSTGLVTPGTTQAATVVNTLGLGAVIPASVLAAINNPANTPAQATQLLIDAINGALATLLNTAATTLDKLALLRVDGVNVGVVTKAGDTPANSAATLTGTLGAVSVGGVDLPPVNVADGVNLVLGAQKKATDTINSALASITATVGGSPVSLQDAVSVEFFSQDVAPAVGTDKTYTTARAGMTAVKAVVKPPVNLDGLVRTITSQTAAGTSIGALITGAGGALPTTLGAPMVPLNTTLGTVGGALQKGVTLNVVQVLGETQFAPTPTASTTGGGGTLPRTGTTTIPWTAVGLLLIALGLGLRSWFSMPLPRFKPPVS